jgi:hypothetical protein
MLFRLAARERSGEDRDRRDGYSWRSPAALGWSWRTLGTAGVGHDLSAPPIMVESGPLRLANVEQKQRYFGCSPLGCSLLGCSPLGCSLFDGCVVGCPAGSAFSPLLQPAAANENPTTINVITVNLPMRPIVQSPLRNHPVCARLVRQSIPARRGGAESAPLGAQAERCAEGDCRFVERPPSLDRRDKSGQNAP